MGYHKSDVGEHVIISEICVADIEDQDNWQCNPTSLTGLVCLKISHTFAFIHLQNVTLFHRVR